MRLFVIWMFLGLLSAPAALAQGNAAAGLAGVGAGAALATTSPNGTTPSSAAGGGSGNTPIEIQIMVFQGMKDIASEVAGLTFRNQHECKTAFDTDPEHDTVEAVRTILKSRSTQLAADLEAQRDNPDLQDKIQKEQDLVANTKAALNAHLDSLSDNTKKACSVLVEDSTSANQIALYQAVQGYYNHLKQLDDKVSPYFALQISPVLNFGFTEGGPPAPARLSITNTTSKPRKIKGIVVTGSPAFNVDTTGCDFKTLTLDEPCGMDVTFPRDGIEVEAGKTYAGTVSITSGDPDSETTNTTQTVQLNATVTAALKPQPPQKGPGKKPGEQKYLAPGALASTSGGGGAAATGGGGAATTPPGLTYLGDLTTALGALKSNITYSASGFQPTAQSFQLLIEAELKARGMFPYTSTSPLNLQEAMNTLSGQFGQMLSWSNDITGWTNQCKPPTTGQAGAMTNTACANPDIIASLSVGQQIVTGYTTLITQANDGSGNPVIVSVLRGMVLATKIGEGIPSLQVTVASAGGSTKTNNIFGVNLFYTFAPSYNAGVIATFELRDKNNVLVESGARNSLVAYTKWKSKSFHPVVMKGRGTCDSFCSVE